MSTIDVQGLKQLSGNDQEFILDVLKLYAERVSEDLKELKKAKESEDWTKARFVVHRMRSAAVPLGLKELIVLLRQAEEKIKSEKLLNIHEQIDQIMTHSQEALDDAKKRLQKSMR
jgi:HPt (histidine-containing phosphotransfer) domain-containing protein